MSRVPLHAAIGVLLAAAVSVPPAAADTQMPTHVRVVNNRAPVQRWYRPRDLLLIVEPGTTLAVLGQEEDLYWVMLPPDAYGTQRSGWVRVGDVEPVPHPAQGRRDEPGPSAVAEEVSPAASVAEDKVTITERRDDTAASTPAAAKAYTFEDVHFDRERYSLRSEDMDVLRTAVAALKGDPSLMVNIEGYTCSLGTKAYNRTLGARRARAVKDYLVSQGVAPERLHTVSLGEERAAHDNSREETRRLNRRVALVPDAKP